MESSIDSARPSNWWYVAATVFFLFAVGAVIAAVAYEISRSKPTGEGELFLEETSAATPVIVNAGSDLTAVRQARNDLQIEAVSVVDPDGMIVVSTSPTLTGTMLDNPVVMFAHISDVFGAAAMPSGQPLRLDGVTEWVVGDTLYAVVYPTGDGGSVLYHYDVSELLARRTMNTGISPGTLVLVGIAFVSAALVAVALIGRTRAASRFQVLEREAELLRIHTAEVEDRNIELDAARAAAEDALALAEEKNRIRSEFVLMINHELRTPLTSVLTGAQLLAEMDLDQTTREQILDDMLRNGHRLEQMISQILEVARIENRGLTSTVTDVPAATVWRHVEAVLPTEVLPDERPELDEVELSTDANTVASLVASLVDNARQHGATHVHVGVAFSTQIDADVEVGAASEPALVLSVADDGPGIDPEFLPRVFEKFEKDSFSSGTGLGLYVVRLMAEAIGCIVAVESRPHGTTFEVRIPGVRSRKPAGVA